MMQHGVRKMGYSILNVATGVEFLPGMRDMNAGKTLAARENCR